MGGTIDGAGLKIRRERRIRFGMWLLVLLPIAVVFALCYRPVIHCPLVLSGPAANFRMLADSESTPAPCGSFSDVSGHLDV